MSYSRHSGNSMIPSEAEHDRHYGADVAESDADEVPYCAPSAAQHALALKRCRALNAQLMAIQESFSLVRRD